LPAQHIGKRPHATGQRGVVQDLRPLTGLPGELIQLGVFFHQQLLGFGQQPTGIGRGASRASRLKACSLSWTLRFSRARRPLFCRRLSRCMVARCGLSRRVSTRDLLDRSSRLFKRSAVTRKTRSPVSVERLALDAGSTGAPGGGSTSSTGIVSSTPVACSRSSAMNGAMGVLMGAASASGSSKRAIKAT